MEYARSLIKRHTVEEDDEHEVSVAEDSTVRHRGNFSPGSPSGYSSVGSARAPSEDWSVISDQEDSVN